MIKDVDCFGDLVGSEPTSAGIEDGQFESR